MRTSMVMLVSAGVALASGCSKEGGVEVQTKDAKVTTAGSAKSMGVPDNFPKDVPVIPGGAVKTALVAKDNVSLILTASSPVADVVKYYQDNLQSQGWKVDKTMAVGNSTIVSAAKDERTCGVQVLASGTGSAITISVRPKGG